MREALREVLAAELARAQRMLEVLRLERDALARRDLPAVEQAAAEKDRLIGLLEGLADQQASLLKGAGIDPAAPELDTVLERAHLPECAATWRELRAVLAECRQQNLVNGGVVDTLRRFARDVLGLMRGSPAGPGTYGRSGEVSNSGGGGPLATA